MLVPYRGGCQCGAIRYELTDEPLCVYACHCTECQKQTASSFALGLWANRTDFHVTQGKTTPITRNADSGREIIGNFCGKCGSRIYHENLANPTRINLKPGTLDDTNWLVPVGHVWTSRAQSWLTLDSDLLNYETQPDDAYQAMIVRYRKDVLGLGKGHRS